MSKRYTVLVMDDKGSPVREARLSKRLIRALAAVLIVSLSVLGIGTYQYSRLYRSMTEKDRMQAELQAQQAGMEQQRKQIQAFALEINELKSSLMALNQFEQKIRILANIEHKTDQASLFAIGGSMPDDLDGDLALNEDHDRLVREMHEQIGQVSQASAVQQHSFETLLDDLKDKRNLLAATPSLHPTKGWISSDFGYRVSPFTGRREFHKGLDIANRKGTPIIAPADGVVTYADKKWLMGNMITIDHGYGLLTRYGHISTLVKKKGDRVRRGEVIAKMGNTGRSTGPHLHYEVRLNGVPVDPMKYILD
ncbi:MAG: M23 family metallopeptidase [Desulfatitalea sp.]|nr:M23 family metallopeptidase [Desulfatitalea sp.]NNK02114.1 M23 family metallopeptidase [Desulfatitalea sp.]